MTHVWLSEMKKQNTNRPKKTHKSPQKPQEHNLQKINILERIRESFKNNVSINNITL